MNDLSIPFEALDLDPAGAAADPTDPAIDQPDLAAAPAGEAGGRAADGQAQALTLPGDGRTKPDLGLAGGRAAGAAGAAGPADGGAVELFGRAEVLVRQVEPGGRSLGELRAAAGAAKSLQGSLDAAMCDITAEIAALTTPGRAAGVISEQTGKSKRDASRLAKVAQGLAAMPNTKKRLAEGGFTIDHAAALVNTAQTAGASAVDNDEALLGLAESKPADVFAGDAKRAELKASRDRGEAELKRQRNARRASLGKDRDSGMGILHAELDPVSHGLLAQAVQTHADRLWRTDSRNGNTAARTGPQRMADALLETITGLDALSHKPLPATSGGKGSGRPQLIITADIGLFDGRNPDGVCEILGTGPVPPAVLERLSPDTAVAGMIFGGDGRALWLGTATRTPNAAQRLAIAVRDKGCVRCGAPLHMADIHHIVEWEHGGPTDIDNLQALCGPCHRQHHHDQDQRNGRQPRRRNKPAKKNSKTRKNNRAASGTQGTIAMNSSGFQHRIPVGEIPSPTDTNRSHGEGQNRQGRTTVGCSPATTGKSNGVSSENLSPTGRHGSREGPGTTGTKQSPGDAPNSTSVRRSSGDDSNPAGATGNRDGRTRDSVAAGKTPAAATRSRDGPDP